MTTYICKCGKTFTKNTEAGTTGFRMPDYGPGHECYGCPFVQKERWREGGRDVDAYACRGSKVLDYQTDAYFIDSKGAALHVRTLDLKFIQAFFKDYLSLNGHIYEHLKFGMDSPENGRRQYSFGFAANKQGDVDRKTLVSCYFRSEGERPGALPSGCDRLVRQDVTPEKEKEIVLNQIKEAKALAQGKSTPAEVGTVYYNHNRTVAYFAGRREDNGQYTVFMDDPADRPDTLTPVATIPDFDTFEQAQNALDGLAKKRGFTAEGSDPGEVPEAEQPDDDPGDLGPDGMEELAEYQELTRPDAVSADDAPESGNDGADSEGGADETPDSEDDTGDSVNEERPPCDWKNASGGDEDEQEEDNTPPENNIPAGEPVSLRDNAFSDLIDICDSKINQALRTMFDLRQTSFSFTAKITFERRGGAFGIKHETGFNFDPIKVKDKGELYEEIPIQLDGNGNPIIPYDHQHQMNFDELQPGREIPPAGGTATVDGKTGIVEHYETDGHEDLPAVDEQGECAGEDAPQGGDPEEKLYPCENFDCPFYGLPDVGDGGCCYEQDVRDTRDPSIKSDVADAVRFYRCTRPEVIQAFAEANPDEAVGSEGDQDARKEQGGDDSEEFEREDDAS